MSLPMTSTSLNAISQGRMDGYFQFSIFLLIFSIHSWIHSSFSSCKMIRPKDHYRHHQQTSPFPTKRKSRRRNVKSLVIFALFTLGLLLIYISTIKSAIQMQANEIDADAGNGGFKMSKRSFLKNNTSTKKIDLVLAEKRESSSKSAVPDTTPSSGDDVKILSYAATLKSLQELTQSPPLGSIVCPSPHFSPIYDKVVHTNSNDRKIPRIIHISFNDRCVPNELAESITRWQEALPDHSMFFHDDQSVQRLIGLDNGNSQPWHSSEHFPGLRDNMRCVKFKGAMLIDIWRMLIVWTYGGIYTDIDNWPGPKFNTHTTIRNEDSFFSLSDVRERPSQWLFGMAPRHPIAIFTLQDISRRLLKIKNIARPRVVHITGPQTLKFAFRKFHLLLEQNATIFGNSSYFTQVQKIGLAESDQYAKGKLGETFEEIVDIFVDERSNITYRNITKRKKTELLSGVIHWTEDVKLGQGKPNETLKQSAKDANIAVNNEKAEGQLVDSYDGLSCIDYLATLK